MKFYVVNPDFVTFAECEMRSVEKQTHPIHASDYMFFPVSDKKLTLCDLPELAQKAVEANRYSDKSWFGELVGKPRRQPDAPTSGYLMGYGEDGSVVTASVRTDNTSAIYDDALAE